MAISATVWMIQTLGKNVVEGIKSTNFKKEITCICSA